MKVLTGVADTVLISATMLLESMPPERNAPSGTSDISWLLTARASVSRKASAASASDHGNTATDAGSQYRRTVTAPS